VPLDGEMGPATVAALCAFQREHSLDVTGKPDKATQDKLKEQHGS
jgi:peptidoglycan hydrolase-like protein with peptidoglycan-binding domain